MKFRCRFSKLSRGMLWLSLALAAPVWSGEGVVTLAPEEIRFAVDASRPGHMAVASLWGDMAGPGLYAARVLIPSGLMVLPHVHPDDRVVVVLSGTLYIGFGEHFDPAALRAMPAGSFFTEPAGKAHFAWARGDDVVVQVSGVGPSGTVYLPPAH